MIVGVTSKNELKVEAVRLAYGTLGIPVDVVGYSTESGVGEQPVEREAYQGARNRIESMGDLSGIKNVISIESGIFDEEGKWVDRAIIIYRNVNPGWSVDWESAPVEFPTKYVDMARERGFQTTRVADIMKENGLVTDVRDPHLDLAGRSRADYINEAVLGMVRAIETY